MNITSSILLSISLALTSAPQDPPVNGPGLDTALVDSYADVFGLQKKPKDVPGSNPGTISSKSRHKRMYLPACGSNWPDQSGVVLCQSAYLLCGDTPDPRDIGYWIFTAPIDSDDPSDWTATGAYVCLGVTDPNEPPLVVPVLTEEDFRRLPLPASPIVVQPSNGRTLVNVPTNLYADAGAVTIPTTVLGQAVRVRATPVEFRWSYGDGEGLVTAVAGAPYPKMPTAHVYRRAGRLEVGLSTVYRGEYSVGGGPWLPVDGRATVVSPGGALDVVSAENRLVAGTSGRGR